jgi:RNA exonuclease 1
VALTVCLLQQALFTQHDVLVGHSLENDLRALKLVHPLVIDTAVCFGSALPGTMKHGLKHLAHRCLGKQMRSSDAIGHDSVEDARVRAMCALHVAQPY